MSSWLGGLGSGLGQSLGQVGGSLSSFTGQISTFTKDMLLEGVEEVGDAVTELQVSNSKLAEVEAAFTTQKSEYDRLRKLYAELEEKHEASEIQIKQQSAEYRTVLQQKDVEISHLKARQSGLQEEVQKLQQSAQSASAGPAVLPVTTSSSITTSSSASSFLSRPSGSHQGFHSDEVDLSDVIWSQQEINRLSTEVMRLEAEVAHWRRMSQAKGAGAGNGDQGDILKLQRTIKELREEMSREVDEHQHELAALQDAQRQKLNDITRRHREELAEYEERIEELEEQIQSGGGQTTSPSDASKLPELQKTIRSLQEAAEQREKQLAELSASLEEAQSKQASLQLEKDDVQEENAGLLQNYARLQASVAELQTRVQEQEERALQKAQLDHEVQTLRNNLTAAEKEIERLKNLAETEPKEEVEHADILELNTIIGTLRQEKEVLEQEKFSLQEKLNAKEEQTVGKNGAEFGESESLEDVKVELERREKALRATEEERDTLMCELEELDRQNQEATQHMISVKEQLKEAEAEMSRLSTELNIAEDQKKALELELEAQKEKMSQSAFTLNDLHMGRQQLERTVNELKDKLGHAHEQGRESRREVTELKKILQEREEQLSSAKAELDQARERGTESLGAEEELAVKERELTDLRRELNELRSSQENVMSEDYELKMENNKLKAECEQTLGKVEELTKLMTEGQAALNRTVREKETRIEALKLEKTQLDDELRQAERTLAEQAKQYQKTIEDLTRARSMDASALQMEHERAIKLNQEKDMEIAQLKRDMEQLASDHRDTNEMLSITVAGQKQLTDLLQEKDVFMDTLKQNAADLQTEMDTRISAATKDTDVLRQALEEKDKQLGGMKEENSHLKEEIDRLRDQQSRPQPLAEPRTLDIITELETEITQLKSSRNSLEEEVQALRRSLEEQQASVLLSQQSLQIQQGELEQALALHQQTTLNYDRLIHARDGEIARLQQTVDELSDSRGRADSPPVQGEVIMQEDKTQNLHQENGNEKHDLSKVEIEKLVRGIKEKESEISQLNEKNLSLTRQLDQLVVSRDEVGKLSQVILQKDLEIQALHARVSMGAGGGHSQDVMFLQQQLQAYAVEREQVLAVLNEKTRENSQLRSDHHRLMDIMAGKEAALLKLQQENQRLSNMSDPSGNQEMFKETIQNLSRIIREKDIEIDALTQKCQTLVTVLQSSGGESTAGSGGVSSNQFEELLHERDTLKQQVKKMEEWKQQVITTVRNMQHESAQLQEELIKLQGQVSADSDCSSKLSVDYTRLIQSYEQKEKRLGSLSQELAHVQQTITQLSTTKDVLLCKLDSVAQTPEVAVVQSSGTSLTADMPSHQTALPPSNEKLQEELVQLQAQIAERENMIRTLKENNHRLSNSASASESEQRSQAEEVRQIRERLESLQRSVREKDLLIKTKGDQLIQVSESLRNRENDNEVLKQAVTNLKERALILEMDVKKLKEENELVAARSREKESEFRALQETNMQFSLLLREKEFELSAMSEKAATVERMLKDKEQGKSGELNQLLNELKSMQDKAVLFQQERDQVMMALKQKQMETTAVQTELQHTRDKEQRLNLELERLRNHLLEIEDSYTREALAAEDRESELRRRVAMLDEKLATSSSAVENASQQASMQVESLQEQLSGVMKQRDNALAQLRTSQDQVNQYAVSLSNLQMVLEQFQQEEKAMYSAELEKLKREKEEWRRKAQQLEDQASALQLNLDEANAALDSASRLTDQLDLKEEQIEELKKQVEVRQEMLEEAQRKLMNLLNSTEGKIDKVLMRNLFLGYFHTPKTKRADVLRLMGSVLGLSREDVDKMLEEDGQHGVTGWMSSWIRGKGAQSVPNTPQRPTSGQSLNSSFSEMFVRFLEMESTPSLPAPKLLVHDIKPLSAAPPRRSISSVSSTPAGPAAATKRSGDSNPFLAPRSAAVPLLAGSSSGSSGGHLLMKPISDALPTFTPVPVSAEASGGAVLKDLLKQ
ncbi:thyroid receptor-interacting protein 11 [Anabas testudineus]|uniref:GRIP domain-containing protein n=1 Tax=Anabas testudineus TaxID=64144 RepID=A0A3Q1JBS3_ANATE|nr:thyroid receptor-interacting protein 11 [Anabas testudineus]XP_026195121.1 thyroid receptor-interacting protein 11 [Anabas testudineus]